MVGVVIVQWGVEEIKGKTEPVKMVSHQTPGHQT